MKCLFVTRKGDDYIASGLWDGLCEMFPGQVYDAVGNEGFHLGCPINPNARISGTRMARSLKDGDDGDDGFDLLVIMSCFLVDFSWEFVHNLMPRLKPTAKIAYVEGWDSAHEVHVPHVSVHAVFRREIDPSCLYPYDCLSCSFAAPQRWFPADYVERPRPWDVFWAGPFGADEARWDMLKEIFRTDYRHKSLVASNGMGNAYYDMLKDSKLVICPPGAARSVSLRTFEAVSAGAIPIFVNMPAWRRNPWFNPDEHCFVCTLDQLPRTIDVALTLDLEWRRKKLLAHCLENHTTLARAKQLLKGVGL
jgi:hypothetical protein